MEIGFYWWKDLNFWHPVVAMGIYDAVVAICKLSISTGCGTRLIYGAHADFYWQGIKLGYPCSCTTLQVQGTYRSF
ncbi:unnamed protein product [Cuscuta campestris]|uniref:Uncharacterized protein n=1 Tax=Cuscuta campestris TaxID=132261 RepID=A0A484LNW5_9ASTE|nr:unnamed protein product [Cuscuta campestris]